jgi:hypothetical protein
VGRGAAALSLTRLMRRMLPLLALSVFCAAYGRSCSLTRSFRVRTHAPKGARAAAQTCGLRLLIWVRRLDPHAQTPGRCTASGAAAQVVPNLLQTSRGVLVRIHQTLKVFPAWPLA